MFVLGSLESVFVLVLIELLSLGVPAESLRAKRDRKSAISLQRGQFDPKFQVEGVAPPIIFARLVRPIRPYNIAADSLHTKNFVGRKSAVLRFWAPFGGLGATYDDHLRLIGKHVLDFLLVLIELFSLGVNTEALRANIGWESAISLQRGPVDPKFHVEGIAPTNYSSYWKIRYNDLSYGIKHLDRSFFRFVTIHAFDRQSDRAFSSLDRVCIACNALINC